MPRLSGHEIFIKICKCNVTVLDLPSIIPAIHTRKYTDAASGEPASGPEFVRLAMRNDPNSHKYHEHQQTNRIDAFWKIK